MQNYVWKKKIITPRQWKLQPVPVLLIKSIEIDYFNILQGTVHIIKRIIGNDIIIWYILNIRCCNSYVYHEIEIIILCIVIIITLNNRIHNNVN